MWCVYILVNMQWETVKTEPGNLSIYITVISPCLFLLLFPCCSSYIKSTSTWTSIAPYQTTEPVNTQAFLISKTLCLHCVFNPWVGWNRFLHGDVFEDEGDNYGVNNFIGTTTWRLFFPDGDIKAEMISPPWNNFLQSLFRFVVVRSGHDEGLGRTSFISVFPILQWQKEEVSQLLL